jgi:HAD superfamily hydrolase (TIGR01509 family)
MIKHIAFDCDNTLISADALHYVALNRALELHGTIITPAEHLSTFKGLPTKRKLAMLVERERIKPEDVSAIAVAKQAATLKAIAETIRPDKAVLALIEMLARLGWAMCCCSNAVRASVEAMLIESQLMPYMAFFLSNEDADPKPSPAIYLKAATLFGVRPEQMVVVEDATPGKLAAKAAGCPLVEVTCPADCTLKLLPAIYRAASLNGNGSQPRAWAFREEEASK